MSASKAKALGLKPLARVRGYGDAELAPVQFTEAPAPAIQKALARSNLTVKDVDLFEINEAFAAVALANIKALFFINFFN